jgi:hypothetical protein
MRQLYPDEIACINITRIIFIAQARVPGFQAVRHIGERGGVMRGDDKKAAIKAYKERKVAAGIYLVRCVASAGVWVGQTPNLEGIQNRIWFTLRCNSHPQLDLQRAWRDHGAENLTFEVIEQLPEEESTYVRDALLKERLAHWRATLQARAI